MKIERLSDEYAVNKVMDRHEYENYNIHKRKELTRFDGYDIEQAYEDGANAILDIIENHRLSDEVKELIQELRGN